MPTGHKERAVDAGLQVHHFAMTFEEIGRVIGANKQTVWAIYQRGLRKRRRKNPRILQQLRDCAHELQANRRGIEEE